MECRETNCRVETRSYEIKSSMNTFPYRLAIDGDDLERNYWGLFIKDEFPSYEVFWIKFVVPLTNRPIDIHFKNDADLAKVGKSKSDISIAQLNYSILRHLIRCFEVRRRINNGSWIDQFDLILEGMTRLVGCHDIAIELLDRKAHPSYYKTLTFDISAGKIARKIRQDSNDPLKTIRSYRDNLVHGRIPPSIIYGTKLCLPSIGKESQYLDWRKTTDSNNPNREKYKKDFIGASDILENAWSKTTKYLEDNWKNLCDA